MDLAEQLIDHMDTFGERTIQGAFCSLINWGLQAVERLGPDHRNEVIGCCGRWWLTHEPEGCEVVSRAWLHLGECIVDLIDTAKTNGGGK